MKNMILNINIKFLYCILFVFVSVKMFAQTDDKPSKYFPNVIPPPPNSASLGLYGQVPLNQFTGNANISIPLVEIKSNSLSLPISLSYSSDGIKVDQYESNIGVGWVLNAGGVVTRQVFDYQDNYNGRLQKPNVAADSSEIGTFLDQASSAPQVDTQPDIFSYNVNGLSGKFFLDDTNTPVEIEPSGLKIEITLDFLSIGYAPNSLPEIVITDTKGIKYYFGGLNAIESSSSRRIFIENPGPISEDVKTSWYLTKIEDPSTNNQITLSYDSRSITYITGNEQSLEYSYSNGSRLTSRLVNYQYKSYSTESILKEINSINSKIVFGNSKRFSDPDFPLFKVDDISLLDLKGTLIKKIKFDYTEYIGNTFSNSYNQFPDYLKKRFYLKQINEFSTNTTPVTHQFEYYSPENLPARFSFAKDNYGVFNGKINSSLISDEITIPNSVIQSSFSDHKLANRRPDKNFGYYGLLKKIIYPTKGNTILDYEPHVKGMVNIAINPETTPFSLNVITDDADLFSNTNTTTIHSSIEQSIKINGNVSKNCSAADPFPLKLIVEVTDSNGILVNFYTNASNSDTPILIGTSYTFTGSTSSTNDFFTLEANKDYSIKIKLLRPCMLGNIYFDYYTNPITFQNIEKQIGGFRISRITKNNITNNKLEIEKYYYSPYNCLTCQSGSYINQAPIAYIRKIERYNLCETPTTRTLYSVGSSNLARIYSSQNAQFGYEFVTKSYGNNFENGSEESKYEIIQDGLPITIQGIVDNSTPLTNGFGAGRLVSFKVLNSTFKTLKETINLYEHNIAKDKTVNGYNSYRSQEPFIYFHGVGAGSFPECLLAIQAQNYSLSQYSLRSQWSYLKQSTESLYDNNGLNPITTIVNYNYNNPIHLQLTSQTTTNSKNETFETKYYYPHDLITEPFMQDLVTVNRIVPPISTEQYNGLTLLSKNKTVYAKDATTSNLLLSKNIYAAKFPNILPNIQYIGQLEKKITYDLYDNKGNILQYTPENGSPVAIIWGYNQSLPVAKIENATYAQVEALSGFGTGFSIASALTAAQEITLRTSLPNGMITIYTHIPLVGVSTITDPKGDKITYNYDALGRLQNLKDKDGNILSENEYHYKN